jgi:glycosyltransferase involved in cell wall biosynthesis
MIKYSNLPLVSIIVCVYNRAQYLEQCLNSIVNQTYSNLEIVIVYNISTDNSLDIINKYKQNDLRIKLYFLAQEGAPGTNGRQSFELGYTRAQGEYIGSVDSDDYIALNCVELCFKNIKDNGLIYTYCQCFGDSNLLENRAKYPYSKEALLKYFMVFHFRLFKKELWNKINKVSEIDSCWDYDLVLRLSEITNFILLPQVLYYWRRHKNQLTTKNNVYYIRQNMEQCRQEAYKRRGLII